MGNSVDGYFFGYNGAEFGILHRINSVDAWTVQSGWNGDRVDGSTGTSFSYNPTFGSPVMIKYPYLGYGNITFFIQNPDNSRWVLVHTIRYANTVTTPQASNPSLYFYGQSLNDGNNTNLIMYCGSVGVFLSGVRQIISPKWATDNNKTGITTETNILTVKNATTYNGVVNRGLMRIKNISVSSSAATGICVVRLKLNATLGGSPSYTPISGATSDGGATITSGNSISSYDTAGTTITGGIHIFSFSIDNPNSFPLELDNYNIFVAPTETLTVSGFSSTTSQIGVSLNWAEDI
jgi:hypothetical protein